MYRFRRHRERGLPTGILTGCMVVIQTLPSVDQTPGQFEIEVRTNHYDPSQVWLLKHIAQRYALVPWINAFGKA